jgi:cytochrome c oxidase subunit 3
MTGVHAIHLATGIGIVGVFAFTLRCRLLPIESLAMLDVATYWHFVDTVWIALFPLLQGRIIFGTAGGSSGSFATDHCE